ncbi:MAG TPA: M3 family metallopeptidase [bacterium]|nr:M3 family metallopeptidase [bacterium]
MRTLHITAAAVLLAACTPKAETKTAAAPGGAASAPAAASTLTHKSFEALAPVDVAPLRTSWTPADLTAACDEAQKTSDKRFAEVVAIPDAKRTFANTPLAMEQIGTDFGITVARLSFMKDIHTDEKVRAAAAECEENAGKYAVQLSARKDLYLAMKGWQNGAGKTEKLDDQDQRLVFFAMRDFHRAGLDLSDADRDKLVKIRQRLAELQTKFARNLDEDKSSITATKAELAGMQDDFIKRLEKTKDGKYVLTTKYPDYYPIMENAKNAELRRRMQVAFMNRGMPENPKLEDEAVALRDQAAKLLGYASHADYATEVLMAKNAKTVAAFESKLQDSLKPRLQRDTAKMEELKGKDTHGKDRKITSWDWRYYLNQIKKNDYALDDEAVRAYFPADRAVNGMFEVYQRLFNIKFQEVPIKDAWADGVKLYEIHDQPSGRLLAKFYVDLYPRPGKYGHAASFDISLARETESGYQIPLSVLVTNFNPPSNGQPAHLSVDEVDTLFHEFGHVMHMSLTTARYSSLAGSNVARDFVEAPSQMLENWVFEPEVLALISQDPKDPKKTIPEDLVKKVVATRTFDSGVKYTRQVFLGEADQYLHTHGDKVDSDRECARLWDETMGFKQDPNEHFCSTFGHPMGGYDAAYYGYLWSLVFASDMFTRFQKEGVLNPQTGRAYRDAILAKGRTQDPDALLREFLGRDPNEEAFLKLAGIKSS